MISLDTIKKSILAKGYKWNEGKLNIVGLRTTLQFPDIFNDVMCVADGNEFKTWIITTEPGVAYQKKLLNVNGCAVLKPNQYVNCYALGFHQNKQDHEALVQVGKVTVLRDKDMDGIAGNTGTEDSGYFGINIHGANKGTKNDRIGAWSAGCQVFQAWKDKEEFIAICKKYKQANGNKFTYTLINETDLIQ